jgi:guanine deaminase
VIISSPGSVTTYAKNRAKTHWFWLDPYPGLKPGAIHIALLRSCCVYMQKKQKRPFAFTPIKYSPGHQVSQAFRFFAESQTDSFMTPEHETFMQLAIQLADKGWRRGDGGPFGAVVVRDGQVIGQGNNRVLLRQDPTAHAEVEAIRDACRQLNSFQLDECILYTSCEPCPMCLGAIYWARPAAVYFACTREDAAAIGFDDHFIYREIARDPSERKIPAQGLLRARGLEVFQAYRQDPHTQLY